MSKSVVKFIPTSPISYIDLMEWVYNQEIVDVTNVTYNISNCEVCIYLQLEGPVLPELKHSLIDDLEKYIVDLG